MGISISSLVSEPHTSHFFLVKIFDGHFSSSDSLVNFKISLYIFLGEVTNHIFFLSPSLFSLIPKQNPMLTIIYENYITYKLIFHVRLVDITWEISSKSDFFGISLRMHQLQILCGLRFQILAEPKDNFPIKIHNKTIRGFIFIAFSC